MLGNTVEYFSNATIAQPSMDSVCKTRNVHGALVTQQFAMQGNA